MTKRSVAIVAALAWLAPGGAALAGPQPEVAAASVAGPYRLAQITIQLGVPDDLVFRVLNAQGYDDVSITHRGLTKSQAQGCRDGARFRMEVSPRGDVRGVQRIGDCPRRINLLQARALLERQGFRDIDIEERADGYTALACRGSDRVRVALDRYGGTRETRSLGPCAAALTPDEIAIFVRSLGYTRVRVTNPRLPRYAVEACREDQRVELTLLADGHIAATRPIGRCPPPIEARDIPRLLADRGLTRIQLVDSRPPRYVARACRGDQRVEIALDRFGDEVDERRIGRCDPPLTRQQIVDSLGNHGYSRIRIVEQTSTAYVAEVCDQRDHLRLRISVHGETLEERQLGQCSARRVDQVLQQLEKDGLSDATVYVEGCRRGARIRVALDGLGEEAGTRTIGQCR